MSVITSISTALPPYKYDQTELAEYMAISDSENAYSHEQLKKLYSRTGIETRYSVSPHFSITNKDVKNHDLSIHDRMKSYMMAALPICIEAIEKCIDGYYKPTEVTHLITVSCTGMSAPGLDIEIAQALNFSSQLNRTSINFMGCYAAIHGMKQADYICKSEVDAVVLVICVELCTLHFQSTQDIETITSNAIFSDGASAFLMVSDDVAVKKNIHGFGIQKFHSQISWEGKKDMAWQISSSGFLMTLSSYIPSLIEKGIKNLFASATEKLNLSKELIHHWAIHPGGRKILDVIMEELQLSKENLESSYKILRQYGNMSSPSILFVLKDLLDNKINPMLPELTFGVAFGPGLVMETVILKNV